jgi:heptosyltransferase I
MNDQGAGLHQSSVVSSGSRILIILTGALGDVVRGLAVASVLRHQLPDCTLHWVVDRRWKGIVGLHKGIDSLVIFDRKAGVRRWFKFAAELWNGDYDVVLDMQRILKSGVMSWLTRAPLRVGFHRSNSKEGNYLFNTTEIAPQVANENKLRHYLTFLDPLGLKKPEAPDFGLAAAAKNLRLPEHFSESRFIGLVLGSSWDSKDWPLSGYLGLCELLVNKRSEKIVLLGTAADRDVEQKIIERFPEVLSLCGATSLEQLLAVVARAKVIIGPDSGPGHLAAAVGTPYVSLFGPTPPERVGPFGMDDLVVRAHVGCMPCYRRTCPGLGKICMRLITAEEVFSRAEYAIETRSISNVH